MTDNVTEVKYINYEKEKAKNGALGDASDEGAVWDLQPLIETKYLLSVR